VMSHPSLAMAVALLAAAVAAERVCVDPGGASCSEASDAALSDALSANEVDHNRESAEACRHFFCGDAAAEVALPQMSRHPLGHGPLVDIVEGAGEEEHSIYVTEAPLFSAAECDEVVALAEAEGGGLPSTKSGKYRIGKAWVREMPGVLSWFNSALETKLYPALAQLFPAHVSSTAQLRAHSVAILKYNESHPATDIHIDDALLAFTVALSPSSSFEGGGTYFESLRAVLPMEQGMVTFRPGAVRHAGHAVSSGLRYVLGGFIALADRVEHVRRLNERGNRLLLAPSPTAPELEQADRLFAQGLRLNPHCSLCHANRADALLRLDRPAEAEEELKAQTALLPLDSDAHFSLGVALRAQGRTAEAVQAYQAALRLVPRDFDAWVNLAAALADLERFGEEADAYEHAAELRPSEALPWLNLGEARLSTGDEAAAELAFRRASAAAPTDARPFLSLGRLSARQSRPAEAIDLFYQGALANSEYFDEAKQGIATARTQQGRLSEALADFESAQRMAPNSEKVRAAVEDVRRQAAALARVEAGLEDRAAEVCGTPCRDVVDTSGYAVCAVSWADGCGDAPPPDGFSAASRVADLCERTCAFYLLRSGAVVDEASGEASGEATKAAAGEATEAAAAP